MKKAFTLIELLVVIAIIGILSSLFYPNFMAAREKARDSQRKSDLKQIQKALELYKQDRNPIVFPTSIPSASQCWTSGGVGTTCPAGTIYMNRFPVDPSPNKSYSFAVNNNTLTYTLCACLENPADPDASPTVSCSACGSACLTGPCYVVTQP